MSKSLKDHLPLGFAVCEVPVLPGNRFETRDVILIIVNDDVRAHHQKRDLR